MIANPDVDVHTKTRNHRKIDEKCKKNKLLKTKRVINTVYITKWGAGFYI